MAVERLSGGSSLIDVLDRVLDKGIVIDAWVRISLVGIDLITVEARVVVASIDTYLKYADAVGLTGLVARPQLTEEVDVTEEVEPVTVRRPRVAVRGPGPDGRAIGSSWGHERWHRHIWLSLRAKRGSVAAGTGGRRSPAALRLLDSERTEEIFPILLEEIIALGYPRAFVLAVDYETGEITPAAALRCNRRVTWRSSAPRFMRAACLWSKC